MSDLDRFDCGNGTYVPMSANIVEIEGVHYAHLVVDCPPSRSVPRSDNEHRSFYLWQPQKDGDWMPIPASELQRVSSLGFDMSTPACASDEEQTSHLDSMILMVDDMVLMQDA